MLLRIHWLYDITNEFLIAIYLNKTVGMVSIDLVIMLISVKIHFRLN